MRTCFFSLSTFCAGLLNVAAHWNDCAAETDVAALVECLRVATTGEIQHCGDGFEYTVD